MALRSSGARSRSGEGAGVACLFEGLVVDVDFACFFFGRARERWAPFVLAMSGLLAGRGEWSC
jgi:hypothetical protein